jgi:hypothetical protein
MTSTSLGPSPGRRVEVPPPPVIASYSGLLPTLRNAGLVVETWQEAVALAVASGQFVATLNGDTVLDVPSARALSGTFESFRSRVTVLNTDGERFLASMDPGDVADARGRIGGTLEEHRPIGCGDADINPPCDDTATKGTTDQADIVTQWPFWVFADDTCSTWAPDMEERKFRALTNLERHQSNVIANELWTGDVAAAQSWPNLSLARSADVVAATVPYKVALAELQQALAECLGDGQSGMIHAPPRLVQAWYSAGGLWYVRDGDADFWTGDGYLVDVFGNVIVASGGYDGSDPDGSVSTTVPFAYATGPVVVRLGAVQFIPDRAAQGAPLLTRDNLLEMRAERPVTYELDGCCIVGAGADLCDESSGACA